VPSGVFGQQRTRADIAALAVLSAGFSVLAVAVWALTQQWFGLLLPLAFVIGAWAGLRAEIRQVEFREDQILVRTFLRTWPIARTHITGIVIDDSGAGIDVLNGARYYLTPRDADPAEFADALIRWWRDPGSGLSC
jgi:hypothetical protein